MTNLEKYNQAFVESLRVPADQLSHLQYQEVEVWELVGHKGFAIAIEDIEGIKFLYAYELCRVR